MKLWRAEWAEPLTVTSVARTHVGRVRQINEDRVFNCPERGLWAVADGMGGHSGGDLAAQMVVDALRRLADSGDLLRKDALINALREANTWIVRRNEALSANAGSTVVAAQITGRVATIAWLGDSRAYLLRGETATQLSHDHSVVQELIDAGLLTVAAAARHPRANVVTRALGVSQSVAIATVTVSLTAGDRLLLCSDGLSRTLQDSSLEPGRDLETLTDTLIADALCRDGSDNISLVCLEIA